VSELEAIGEQLRSAYREIVEEPIPDDMLELLDRME
jgi:hypothetical protein